MVEWLIKVLTLKSNLKFNFRVNSKSLKSNIKGSGKLSLAGKTQNLQVKIFGKAEMKAAYLTAITAKNVNVKAKGPANFNLYVTEKLQCELWGKLIIRYQGDPIIKSYIHGKGRIARGR